MNKIALGFAAAMIGTTGIASAALADHPSASASAGGQSATVAVDANPAGLAVGLPAVPSVSDIAAAAAAATADSPVPPVCSVIAGVPVPDAVASAMPAQVRTLGNGAIIDASRVTGQQLIVTGGTTLGAGCTADLPAADLPALPALPAVSVPVPRPAVTIPSVSVPTAEVPALPALPAVPSLPQAPSVGDVVNHATGTVAALPALPASVSLASCSATGSASTNGVLGGLLGGVTATINGIC